jgi:site-specific DNA recombinase
MIREDLMIEPLEAFFQQRIFGAGRKALLATAAKTGDKRAHEALTDRKATLTKQLAELQRRQDNLIGELERFETSGDAEVDAALRTGIKNRFASAVAEQRQAKEHLDQAIAGAQASQPVDLEILDQLPEHVIELSRLPDAELRALYDAFHLELRFDPNGSDLVIRVTVTTESAPILASTLATALGDTNHTGTVSSGNGLESAGVRELRHAPPNVATGRELLWEPGGAPISWVLSCENTVWDAGFLIR